MQIAIQPRWFLALLATFVLSSTGWAQQASPLTSELQVQRVESIDGQTVYQPAQVTKPGDVLEYRVTYTNHSSAALRGLTANLPIPAGTTLLDRTQLPPDAMASTDGKQFAPLPLMHAVRLPDGTSTQQPVPLSEYRALRWNLGTLDPGKSAQAQARVSVNAPAQSASAAPQSPRG
jgi:uncharacterized repeat protein (TIGR01451 family)